MRVANDLREVVIGHVIHSRIEILVIAGTARVSGNDDKTCCADQAQRAAR
jgi:hypothetical protein